MPEKRGLGQVLGVKQLDHACAQGKQVELTPIMLGKSQCGNVVGPGQHGRLDMLQQRLPIIGPSV